MVLKTLSITERQILANQFKILSKLEDDNEFYERKVEILEEGYTGQYREIFVVSEKEISYDICIETHDILTMFRGISNAIPSLNDEQIESLDFYKLHFKGFDANQDKHYYYARFMIEGQGKWPEYRELYLNSHNSNTILEYRKMLTVYKKIIRSNRYEFTFDDLKKFNSVLINQL